MPLPFPPAALSYNLQGHGVTAESDLFMQLQPPLILQESAQAITDCRKTPFHSARNGISLQGSSVMDRQSDLCIPFILHIKISPMAEPRGRKLSFLSYESPTQNARAAYLQAKRLNRLYIYTRAFILHNLSFLCIFMHILLHDKRYKSIG